MFSFIFGILTGVSAVLIGCALLLNEARRRAPAPVSPDKLAEARKYLTTITATTSLNHAQKIAHKALKVIS